MHPVPPEQFEELVGQALDRLPPELAARFDNVVLLVEDQQPGQPDLLGLYEGVALTERDNYSGALPDRITLYRLPLCRVSSDLDDLAEQVEVTVVHEFAHHMGIDDERLHELGWA